MNQLLPRPRRRTSHPKPSRKKKDAGAEKAEKPKAKEGAEEPKASDTDAKGEEQEAKKEDTKDAKPEEKKPPKPKFIQIQLGVTSTINGELNKAKIDAYRNREAGLAQEERIARERDERRNDLETYVYDIRD